MILEVGEPCNPSRMQLVNQDQKARIELDSNNLMVELDKRTKLRRSKDASTSSTATFRLSITMPVSQMDKLIVSCLIRDDHAAVEDHASKKRKYDDVDPDVKGETVGMNEASESLSSAQTSISLSPEAIHDLFYDVFAEDTAPQSCTASRDRFDHDSDVTDETLDLESKPVPPNKATKPVDKTQTFRDGTMDDAGRLRNKAEPAHSTATNPAEIVVTERATASAAVRQDPQEADALPLHAAAAANDEERVRSLLVNGADWKQLDERGRLAIERSTSPAVWKAFGVKMAPSRDILAAAEEGDRVDVMLMVGDGIDITRANKYRETALHLACDNGYYGIVNILLANGPREWVNGRASTFIGDLKNPQQEITPLHLAAAKGYTGIVERLIDSGAELDMADKRGRTALLWAMRYERFDTAMLLVSCGANVNSKDDYGWTPFLSAAYYGRIELVKKMVENGADLSSSLSGKTALTLAKSQKYTAHNVVTYLKYIGVGETELYK
ncbi:hypothetical protein HDU96_007575 [Phlyctochytrium bullatum]|nr:hypothetical protein HDU96_007575 [Phlyctochytrium bullatum]